MVLKIPPSHLVVVGTGCKLRTCSELLRLVSQKKLPASLIPDTIASRGRYCKDTRGRRQLARNWREEMAYDLSEPKKRPPQEDNDERKGRNGATSCQRGKLTYGTGLYY